MLSKRQSRYVDTWIKERDVYDEKNGEQSSPRQ